MTDLPNLFDNIAFIMKKNNYKICNFIAKATIYTLLCSLHKIDQPLLISE